MRIGLAFLVGVVFAGAACKPPPDTSTIEDPHGPVSWTPGTWNVVWQDEFEGPAGTPPDPTKWAHALGGDGWGNKELQYYTDSPSNAALDGEGHLVITARRETYETNAYTSARLTTKGLFSQAYGRFEARLKLARGLGLWPAFWILGDDFDRVGWPTCGEMDIVEEKGSAPMRVSSSLHGPSTTPVDVPVSQDVALPTGADADFHDYAVEWDPDDIVFLVDGKPTFQITPARRPLKYAPWVWNHPFHMILNLAVGGLFPGPPDDTTPFPATIQADWVRVSVRAGDGGATNDAADRETVDAGADAVASDQNDLDVATGD